jgi:hypothetical protein
MECQASHHVKTEKTDMVTNWPSGCRYVYMRVYNELSLPTVSKEPLA